MSKVEIAPKRLTKAEKIVAIARDCKTRITGHRLLLKRSNGYLVVPKKNLPVEGSVQKHICDVEKKCEVCALGGLLLSTVRLYNKLNFEAFDISRDYYYGNGEITSQMLGIYETFQLLSKYFDRRALALIEGVFEGRVLQKDSFVKCESLDEEELEKAQRRVKKYRQDLLKNKRDKYSKNETLLLGICNNLIKNKGQFVLPE